MRNRRRIGCRLATAALALLTLAPQCGLGHGRQGAAALPEAAGVVTADEGRLVVGSFNIRYDNEADGDNAWRRRRPLVAAVLRRGDVFGLQEALPHQIAEILQDCPEFACLQRTRERDPARGEACPILFRQDRFALDPQEHGTFWLSQQPDVAGSQSWDAALPRIATFARLRGRDGRAFYVYNVHLDHRGAQSRVEAAALLCHRIAARAHPDPVVALGDFNCGPDSAPLQTLLDSRLCTLVDVWRRVHPDSLEQGTFHGWRDALHGPRIDFVLASPEWQPEGCEILLDRPDGRWPSDHAPVLAALLLPATGASRSRSRRSCAGSPARASGLRASRHAAHRGRPARAAPRRCRAARCRGARPCSRRGR